MSEFPENILDVFEEYFKNITGVEHVVRRNLRESDPNGTLALCVDEWVALESEMNPYNNFEPTLVATRLAIVHMVKNGNKQAGELTHRNVAKSIREMLYRDEPMQLALRTLSEDALDGRHVRPLRWGIIRQQFASNEIENNFVSVSSTEVEFITETV